jgi:hypothetical protein
MTKTDHTHHLLDPLDESIGLEAAADWVESSYEAPITEAEVRVAFQRTNGYVLPMQKNAAEIHGETSYPALLRVRGGERNRPLIHLGQRFRVHAYRSKKRTGNFEVTQIHTCEEERGMDAHHITCKRVLETKVSEAAGNTVTFPHTAFDTAMPFDHYNRIVWEMLGLIRARGHMLSLVEASDPASLESEDSEPSGEEPTSKATAQVLPHSDEQGRPLLEDLQPSAAISDRL